MTFELTTDGAYFSQSKLATYGYVIEETSTNKTITVAKKAKLVSDPEKLKYGQVYAELQAVLDGIGECIKFYKQNKAAERDKLFIVIQYDYIGIEKWAKNLWKANNEVTQRYRELMNSYIQEYTIFFSKLNTHTGKNKEVHNLIQLKEIGKGVFEFDDVTFVNLTTNDPEINKFFKEYYARTSETKKDN